MAVCFRPLSSSTMNNEWPCDHGSSGLFGWKTSFGLQFASLFSSWLFLVGLVCFESWVFCVDMCLRDEMQALFFSAFSTSIYRRSQRSKIEIKLCTNETFLFSWQLNLMLHDAFFEPEMVKHPHTNTTLPPKYFGSPSNSQETVCHLVINL